MLVGREAEQRTIDALLQRAREGRSGVLVIRGEPGIGKSALLEHAARTWDGMPVLRCVGIEAEHELPFAGMHQLVRPSLHLIDRLAAPQAAALRAALGLSDDGVEDRFLVSLGLLSLLAEASEDQPLLCCVDDAQWLDRPSADALVFAARRLHAEPLAVLVAARDGDPRRFDAPGLDELHLDGLGAESARALLTGRLHDRADEGVVSRLLRAARGNPLALLELPAGLTGPQLEGREPILGPPPVRGAVEAAFRARVDSLPAAARLVLLLAAADEDDDPVALGRAAAHAGLNLDALDAAERAGLVRVTGVVVFRHPLVPSAVYRSATRAERRAAHLALAAVVDDPARRAWHRALVADAADATLAAELEAAGAEAARRGAHATAAAAFERAAELTADRALRGYRLRRAAQATLDAGRPDAALGLAERARPFVADPVDAAELTVVRMTVGFARGTPDEFYGLVVEVADGLAAGDPDRALEMLTALVFIAGMGGRWAQGILDTRRAIDELRPAASEVQRSMLAFLDGAALLMDGDAAAARWRLEEAIAAGERFGRDPLLALAGLVSLYVGDARRARALFARGMDVRRARSAATDVAGLLPLLVAAELGDGRLAAAESGIAEGLPLMRELGWENQATSLECMQAQVAALHGDEAECRALATGALRRGLTRGLGWAVALARLALAELELGLGHPRDALEHLDQLPPGPIPPYAQLAAPDVIDAALRLGDRERALTALERLEAWAPVTDAAAVRGVVARCRGVLAEDAERAFASFETALAAHADASPFERARTELAYGERLRRERRRVEARTHLRNALGIFEGMDAALWAERAGRELRASGETARRRDVTTVDDLTPQELRIAELVAAGASNRDVAGQLFVSPKTVEYHLRKVFLKLGVGSRVELAHASLGPRGERVLGQR